MKQEIIQIGTSKLIPYVNNAKVHSDEQITKIAASIKEFGFVNPILIDNDNGVIAGHGRLAAAKLLKLKEVPTICIGHLTKPQKKAYILADNRLGEIGVEWDMELVNIELEALELEDFDIELTGFDYNPLQDEVEGLTDEDEVPDVPKDPVTVLGDVWLCGNHRVMCGDSTAITDVDRLMDGQKAQLLHADPPYGMKKEKDGVLNDNLNSDDLCQFQMDWWNTYRSALVDNASAYIWGNAEELWKLWFNGLGESERLTFRNFITWNKANDSGLYDGNGIGSGLHRSYAAIAEYALFLMLGEQGFNNNADNYWEGFEPIRLYLYNEAKKANIANSKAYNAVVGSSTSGGGMYAHQISPTGSQWHFLTKEYYQELQTHCQQNNNDAFKKDYDELKKDYDELKQEFNATRAHFDNTHENMTDVWNYKRVKGEERHGHATPKPVEMMERVMNSSLPEGGLCIEPFCGSGSTLMGAEKTHRRCYTMELDPRYVDVTVKRWQSFTGKFATLESDGRKFSDNKEPD